MSAAVLRNGIVPRLRRAARPTAALAILLRSSLLVGMPAGAQVTAFSTDCPAVGKHGPTTGYQFVATCAGQARSPDGQFAVVQQAYHDDPPPIELRQRGRVVDEIAALGDAMPFVVFWSPDSRRFFVNHYLGSGLDRLRVFDVVGTTAVEQSGVYAEAIRTMLGRYPCLRRRGSVEASGWRWSRDGRRIALIAYTRPDACLGENNRRLGDWQPLWMIGDAATGRIDPGSVRVRRGGVGPMPRDGPWARLDGR